MLFIAFVFISLLGLSYSVPVSQKQLAATQRALGLGRILPSSLMEELSRVGKGGGGGPPPPPTTTTNAPLVAQSSITGTPDPGQLQSIINDYPVLEDLSGSTLPGILPDYNKACVVPWQLPPYWGYILPPNTCDRERAAIMSILYDVETPATWQLLQNWWGAAYSVDQDLNTFEMEADELRQTLFGKYGNLQMPYGTDGYYSYAKAVRRAADELAPIVNRLYQETSDVVGKIKRQVDADSQSLSSVSKSALEGLAAAIQSAYNSEYNQQHVVNSQILLAKSNQRLSNAHAALLDGVAAVNVMSAASATNTMSSQITALSTSLKSQNSTMQVFNSTMELLLTQQMNQIFAKYLTSKTLPKLQAANAAVLAGYQSSATQASQLYQTQLSSILAADSVSASAGLSLRNQSSSIALQNLSSLVSAAIAEAVTNLTALQSPLSLEFSTANTSILGQLRADTALLASLDKQVSNASLNASGWGATIDPTTGKLSNAIASKRAELLSQISSGALTSNSSMLQAIIVALGDIENARNAMLRAAATSEAKMTAMLTQISAQLGLSLQDTIFLIGNLSSTVAELKASLSGSIQDGALQQMNSASSMTGQLQGQLMASAYTAANASLQAMKARSALLADGKSAAGAVLSDANAKLTASKSITTVAAQGIKSTAADIQAAISKNSSIVAQAQASQSQALSSLVASLKDFQEDQLKQGNESNDIIGTLSLSTANLGAALAARVSNFSKYATILTQRTFDGVIDRTERKLATVAATAESDVMDVGNNIITESDEYTRDMKDLNATAMTSLSEVQAVQTEVAAQAATAAASMDKLVKSVKSLFESKTGANEAVLANAGAVLQADLAALISSLYQQVGTFTNPMSRQASDLAVSSGKWYGELAQRLKLALMAIAEDQEDLDALSAKGASSTLSAQAGMVSVANAVAGFSNSSSFQLNNLTLKLATLNSSITRDISLTLSDFTANTSAISKNVSTAIQAIVDQYTTTVEGVNRQIAKIHQSINASGLDAQNATLVQATLTRMKALVSAEQQLATFLDSLRSANKKFHTGNLSFNVLLPSFTLADSVRQILETYAKNETWLSGLLTTVGSLAGSTMQSTWSVVQQGQEDSMHAILKQEAEAQYDILSQSGANQQNAQLAQATYESAAAAVANQNQALAEARYASANSAQSVLQDVTSSRAKMTAMLGNALNVISANTDKISGDLLAAQSQSSTNPAAVRQTVSNILSSWDAFGQTALSSADKTFASAASVVQDQEVSMKQKAVRVGRQIISSLQQSVDDLTAITGLVRNLYKFANLTTAQIPVIVYNTSASIQAQQASFEQQLRLQLSQIVAAAQTAAQQAVANASAGFAAVVNATENRLAAIPAFTV